MERPLAPTDQDADADHRAARAPNRRRIADATERRRADTGRRPPSRATDTGAPSRDEMSVAFTPAQLAVGGAVVAGLLVVGARILLGRRRGRG